MKIGIITFHRAHNYGAVLQCYALSLVLKKMGHKVEIIDYYPEYFKEQYAIFSLKTFKEKSFRSKIFYIGLLLFTFLTRKKRKNAFNKFIEKLPLTKKQYNETSYSFEKYDVVFFGSDQIWNPLLTFGEDKVFSGNFDKLGAQFVSYAASTSPKILNNEYKNYFKGIAERFDAISTREQSLSNFMNELSPNSSTVVLDPVLLLNEDEWSKIAIKPQEENYLLIYTVPQCDKIWELAEMIAQKKNLKIIEIRPNVKINRKKNVLQTVSPEEFLGYFKHASFVVTTSFHGTAFSVKFNKQFTTLKLGTHADDRAKNFLLSIELEERLIDANNISNPSSEIDYVKVNNLLQCQKNISFRYIQDKIEFSKN